MSEPRLEPLLRELFGARAPRFELDKLEGDASTRRYYRARLVDADADIPKTAIVMQLPADAMRSDEGGEQPTPERLPFLEVGELLADRGIPVPTVYGEDHDHGVLLLEDLGDRTLYSVLGETPREQWVSHYERAIDLLVTVHERCAELPESSIVRRRRFDRDLLQWELDHFLQWGLEALFGECSTDERAVVQQSFRVIADSIEQMPLGFVHRDYQSKNLMVSPTGELTLIDYQDALMGPRAYDLVALLCDSYVPLEHALQLEMVDRYAALRDIDPRTLRSEFRWLTLHRKLKDAGRFVFIDRVRKNSAFLKWFPQSLVYVGRALSQTPSLSALRVLLNTAIPGFPDSVEKPTSVAE